MCFSYLGALIILVQKKTNLTYGFSKITVNSPAKALPNSTFSSPVSGLATRRVTFALSAVNYSVKSSVGQALFRL